MSSPSDQPRRLARPEEGLSHAASLALRIRWRLRSIPPTRLGVAAVGLMIGLTTWYLVESAQQARAHWGDQIPVLVASTDIASGTKLDATNSELIPYPLALVPKGAITSLENSHFVNHPVSTGQVIVSGQAGPDRHGLTPQTREVTLPQPLATPAVQVGDTVELIAVRSGLDRSVATTIGSAAISNVSEESITVIVDRLLIPAIFETLGSGSLEFARRPAQR